MVADAEARVDKEVEALTTRMESIKANTRSSLLRFFIACFGAFSGKLALSLFDKGILLSYRTT
jgi:glucokinase